MKDNIILGRNLGITFAGDNYHLDMEENLGAVSPVSKVDRTLDKFPIQSIFQTSEQKRLRDFFK